MPTLSFPAIAIRGRSFIALIVSPELPLEGWFAALDAQMSRSAGFFANRPIIVNLAAVLEAEEGVQAVLEALEARNLGIVGVEGIDPAQLAGTRWERLQRLSLARGLSHDGKTDRLVAIADDPPPEAAAPPPAPVPAVTSLLIDRPVRSGQSIIFEEGDVTVIGAVASGAEIIAGGSIHIYGALRGRAVAGLKTGADARIFCQKLAAELVAIDGIYEVPEQWGESLLGRAVQICLEQGALRLLALD